MQIGSLVVCVDDVFPEWAKKAYTALPVKGEVYTVREMAPGRGVPMRGNDAPGRGVPIRGNYACAGCNAVCMAATAAAVRPRCVPPPEMKKRRAFRPGAFSP